MPLPAAIPLAELLASGIGALGVGTGVQNVLKNIPEEDSAQLEDTFKRLFLGPSVLPRTIDTPSGKVFAPDEPTPAKPNILATYPQSKDQPWIMSSPMPTGEPQGIISLPIPETQDKLKGFEKPLSPNFNILNKEDTSYRIQHQPKGPESEDPVRLDNLTRSTTGKQAGYPDYFYSNEGQQIFAPGPKFKDDEFGIANQESFKIINEVRNKPDAEVIIYRAVPNNDNIKDINKGDFVTLSKKYAELHGASGYGAYGNESGKILEKKVKVKDLYWDQNDVNEFGYFPTKVENNKLNLTEVNLDPEKAFDITDTNSLEAFPFNPVDFKKNGILNNPEIIKAFSDLKNDVKIKPPVGFNEDYMVLQQSDSFYLTPPRAQMEITLKYLEKQLKENKASEETIDLIKTLNKNLQDKIKDTGYYGVNKKVEGSVTNLPGMTNKLNKLKSSN